MTSKLSIQIKRAYEAPASSDGLRFLIDRLWPRGLTKENLHLDGWLKDVAPSDGLRRWFGHDPARWTEFTRRYVSELDGNVAAWQPIVDAARHRKVTLLYGAKDLEHNHAVALSAYLARKSG